MEPGMFSFPNLRGLSQLHWLSSRGRLQILEDFALAQPPCFTPPTFSEMLFQGGQGKIYAETLNGQPCAVKVFTRDGKRSAAASAERAVSALVLCKHTWGQSHIETFPLLN
jgi:hypothetical protein